MACGPITSGGRTPSRSLISFPCLPCSFLACPFTSFHFTAVSDSFIRIPFPFRSRCSLHFPASRFLSSALFIFVQFLRLAFRSLPVTPVSLHFPSAPCFASPACIASSASCRMMLALLGVLSSIRHHPKRSFLYLFLGAARRCYKNRLNESAYPLPLIREGPAAHVLRMVGGMGRTALYLKVSPAGLACGPITSGGRIYTDATQPATGRPALFVLSFPFPLIPASSRDLNFISFACHAVSWHLPALPFAHISSLHLLERPFTARTPFL